MERNLNLYTGCDSRYFVALLNLWGSISKYNECFTLHIYDFGLKKNEMNFIESLPNVILCKLSITNDIFNDPYCAKVAVWYEMMSNGHQSAWLDAGLLVVGNLSQTFQDVLLKSIISIVTNIECGYSFPVRFLHKYDISEEIVHNVDLGSGFIVFNFESDITRKTVELMHEMGLNKECSGWSRAEAHRNKGLVKADFIDDCPLFRHDQSVFIRAYYKYFGKPDSENLFKYGHPWKLEYTEQVIFPARNKVHFMYPNVMFKSTNKNIFILTKLFARYIVGLTYLTLKRTLLFWSDSKLIKRMKIENQKWLYLNTSDLKFINFNNFSKILLNEPVNKSLIPNDSYLRFKECTIPKEINNIQAILQEHSEELITKKYLMCNVTNLNYDILEFLLKSSMNFYIRFRKYEIDILQRDLVALLQSYQETYEVFDKNNKKLLLSDTEGFFVHHKDYRFHYSAFHRYEYVELYFKLKHS